MSIALEGQQAGGMPIVMDPGFGFRLTAVTTLVTGTMFLMWLGEQITERGVGNGIILMLTIIYLPEGLVSPKWFRQRKTEAEQGETAVA